MKPFVSVLLAARNEEDNIAECLTALQNLNYPKDCYEVIIGNDRSTDETEKIIQTFLVNNANFKLLNINENVANLFGKANVLTQLYKHAKADWLFVTDADTQVNPEWINGMMAVWDEKVGIVSGYSIPEGKSWFEQSQAVDWILALTIAQQLSVWKIPVTAIGSNLMFYRKAYESVGGYETIGASIVEDFQLFRAIIGKGWDFKNLINPKVRARTKSIPDLKTFRHQRKRWFQGILQMPWYLQALAMLPNVISSFGVLLLFVFPIPVLIGWIIKILLQDIYLYNVLGYLNKKHLRIYLWTYEFYLMLTASILIAFFLLPVKPEWKGRKM